MSNKKNIQSRKNKIIHISIIIFFIIIIFVFAGMVMLKYQVEGETDAIFDVSKVLVISTAEGVNKENPTAKWDYSVNQNNDLYITIEKNNKKKDAIKTVTINNIQIQQNPLKGTIQMYKPAETGLFKCNEQYKVQDEIKYIGSKSGNLNNLEISNQGGTIIVRFCNENVTSYTSNEDEQIIHNGTLLSKTGIELEELYTKIQFDIIIETESNIKFKTTVTTELPIGNIIDEGTSTTELNTDELVLKRM